MMLKITEIIVRILLDKGEGICGYFLNFLLTILECFLIILKKKIEDMSDLFFES